MSSVISLRADTNNIPLQVMAPREGHLLGRLVQPILKKEFDESKDQLIHTTCCCCIPYIGTSREARDEIPVSRPAKFIARFLPCAFFVCSLPMAVVLFAKPELVSNSNLDAVTWLGVIPLAIAIYSCAMFIICGPGTQRCPPYVIYDVSRADYVREKMTVISEFLKRSSFKPEHIAELIYHAKLTKDIEKELLDLFTVEEFNAILTHLEFMQFDLKQLRMKTSTKALYELLRDPPENSLVYLEMLFRAEDSLRTEEDYRFLRELLPPGDERRCFQKPQDPDSTEASDDSYVSARSNHDTIAIDIVDVLPGKVVLWLGGAGQPFFVDHVKLNEQSEYFRVMSTGVWREKLLNETRTSFFKKELKSLLHCLSGSFSSLWIPIIPAKKEDYFVLLDAMEYYQFNQAKLQLCEALLNSTILTLDEKKGLILRVLVAPSADDNSKRKCAGWVFNQVMDVSLSPEALEDWLDFAITHFSATLVPYLNGYITGRGDLSVKMVVCIIRLREHFPHLIPRVIQVISTTIKDSFHEYAKHPHLLKWYANQMAIGDKKFISTSNYMWQWENKEWRACKEINLELEKFALKKGNREELLRLWPVHKVPLDLLELWQHYSANWK